MTSEIRRKKKIQKHISTLKAGGNVSRRDLKVVLSYEQLNEYDDEWRAIKSYEAEISTTRHEFKKYLKLLKVGDQLSIAYGRGLNGRTEQLAEAAYEKALEHLEEILSKDSSLAMYLDREVNLLISATWKNSVSLSCAGVPRLRNSRSGFSYKQLQKLSKKEHKLQTLQGALSDYQNVCGGDVSIDDVITLKKSRKKIDFSSWS